MLARTILGIVGIAGLAAGVWILAHEARQTPGHTTLRDQFCNWMVSLDSFLVAIGWTTWMGLFGGLVSFSITGQTMV